jgi:hypothetical protein
MRISKRNMVGGIIKPALKQPLLSVGHWGFFS